MCCGEGSKRTLYPQNIQYHRYELGTEINRILDQLSELQLIALSKFYFISYMPKDNYSMREPTQVNQTNTDGCTHEE